MAFRDRSQAGRLLARRLLPYSGRQDMVVLGLPRGGVVVASEVADALGTPLDVFSPENPAQARRSLAGRIVLVVDDGMATGATMEAALAAIRSLRPGWLVVAVPVAPHPVCARVRHQVDELVCLEEPPDFRAVSDHYDGFEPVDDQEVQALLRLARTRQTT